jgi:DNA-binding CsgD family transcriptional regulator
MDALSPRELEVLRMIVRGLSNKQIARELGLSPHTVKRHVCRLFERIGVGSRMEAAVWHAEQTSTPAATASLVHLVTAAPRVLNERTRAHERAISMET